MASKSWVASKSYWKCVSYVIIRFMIVQKSTNEDVGPPAVCRVCKKVFKSAKLLSIHAVRCLMKLGCGW